MDKKMIRQQMTEKRNSLLKTEQERLSDEIAGKLLSSDLYKNFQNICIYEAFRGEVLCDKIREQCFLEGKQVYVPVTDKMNHCIEFYSIDKNTRFVSGAYGILEPVITSDCQVLRRPALILMPGLAFDYNRHRIGYGGGYYDRYLECQREHTTAALCYSFQVLSEDLPWEEHDILPDYIITEKEII